MKTQFRYILSLTATGLLAAAFVGCLGASATTSSDAASLSTQTKGSADSTKSGGVTCGHHEERGGDSLEAKDAKDTADAKGEVQVGAQGCDEKNHQDIAGKDDGDKKDSLDVKHTGGKDDSLEVAGKDDGDKKDSLDVKYPGGKDDSLEVAGK